jgi:hypothetical protein
MTSKAPADSQAGAIHRIAVAAREELECFSMTSNSNIGLRALLFAICTSCAAGLWCSARAADIRSVVEADRSIIAITGPIETGDYDQFLSALESGTPDLVVLASPGGDLAEGLAIAAEIALLDLPTFVGDGAGCFSACALIWVAGSTRVMGEHAEIGVHAAYYLVEDIDGALEPVVSSVGNANIGAFLNEIGLDRDAIEFFVAPPPDRIALLTPARARVLNIPVRVASSDGTVRSTSGPSPRDFVAAAARHAELGRTCSILIEAEGDVFERAAEAMLRAANAEFGSEVVVGLISQEARRIRSEIDGEGRLLWCLETLLDVADAGLHIGIDGPSYACPRAATPTERAICAHPRLWIHDRVLSTVYTARRLRLTDAEAAALLETQRAWLARRDACSGDHVCLEALYRSRLEEIR